MRIDRTSTFKKDYKRMMKRGKDNAKIKNIICTLAAQKTLDAQHHDHELTSNWKGWRECHIESDWLLIYQLSKDVLLLGRTGSHSDLFK